MCRWLTKCRARWSISRLVSVANEPSAAVRLAQTAAIGETGVEHLKPFSMTGQTFLALPMSGALIRNGEFLKFLSI